MTSAHQALLDHLAAGRNAERLSAVADQAVQTANDDGHGYVRAMVWLESAVADCCDEATCDRIIDRMQKAADWHRERKARKQAG